MCSLVSYHYSKCTPAVAKKTHNLSLNKHYENGLDFVRKNQILKMLLVSWTQNMFTTGFKAFHRGSISRSKSNYKIDHAIWRQMYYWSKRQDFFGPLTLTAYNIVTPSMTYSISMEKSRICQQDISCSSKWRQFIGMISALKLTTLS